MPLNRWTTKSGDDTLVNTHTRLVPGGLDRSQQLLGALHTDAGPWPSDRWWPLLLDHGMTVGSGGGHGPVRYHVAAAESNSVTFRLDDTMPFGGWHRFDLARRAMGVEWRHQLHVEDTWLVRAVALPLHDALLEDLLDSVDALASGAQVRRPPFSPIVRLQRTSAVALGSPPLPR